MLSSKINGMRISNILTTTYLKKKHKKIRTLRKFSLIYITLTFFISLINMTIIKETLNFFKIKTIFFI